MGMRWIVAAVGVVVVLSGCANTKTTRLAVELGPGEGERACRALETVVERHGLVCDLAEAGRGRMHCESGKAELEALASPSGRLLVVFEEKKLIGDPNGRIEAIERDLVGTLSRDFADRPLLVRHETCWE